MEGMGHLASQLWGEQDDREEHKVSQDDQDGQGEGEGEERWRRAALDWTTHVEWCEERGEIGNELLYLPVDAYTMSLPETGSLLTGSRWSGRDAK